MFQDSQSYNNSLKRKKDSPSDIQDFLEAFDKKVSLTFFLLYIKSSDGNPDPESESGIRPIFGQFWNPNPDPESVFYSGFRILNW